MKKKLAFIMAAALTVSALLAGCGNSGGAQEAADTEEAAEDTESAGDDTASDAAADGAQEAETEAEEPSGEKVVLKCVCDLTLTARF